MEGIQNKYKCRQILKADKNMLTFFLRFFSNWRTILIILKILTFVQKLSGEGNITVAKSKWWEQIFWEDFLFLLGQGWVWIWTWAWTWRDISYLYVDYHMGMEEVGDERGEKTPKHFLYAN